MGKMKKLLDKYAKKLVDAGLAEEDAPLIGGLDADLVWNRQDSACHKLEKVFENLNINSLLFCQPKEPYGSIIDYLTTSPETVTVSPEDCETRTFMHDFPVIHSFETEQIINTLKKRRSVIIPGHGIVTWGTVSPEQAFIFFSSVCFSCFVKFFYDYLNHHRQQMVSPYEQHTFEVATSYLDSLPDKLPLLMKGPFETEHEVYRALSEAGRKTVEYRLVDSFFGNISYRFGDTLYISQTGASLDELDGCIDPCPLDGSSCGGLTASSELTAHQEVIQRTGMRAILHGHPRFSVILSMACEKQDCEHRGECHIRCKEKRFIYDIPIVPGEIGSGPYGLCHTLPQAMVEHRGVIVHGHGLFTVGQNDFNEAFATMISVERMCMERFFNEVSYDSG